MSMTRKKPGRAYYFLNQGQGPAALHADEPVQTVCYPESSSLLLHKDKIFAIELVLWAIKLVKLGQLDEPECSACAYPTSPVVGARKLVVGYQQPGLHLFDAHDPHVLFAHVKSFQHLPGFVVQGAPEALKLGGERHGQGPHGILQAQPMADTMSCHVMARLCEVAGLVEDGDVGMHPVKVQLIPIDRSVSDRSKIGLVKDPHKSARIRSSTRVRRRGDGGEAGNLKGGSGKGAATGVVGLRWTCISLSQARLPSGGVGR